MKTYGETWVRFRIQYYIYAIDVRGLRHRDRFSLSLGGELCGICSREFGYYALVEMVVFLVILLVGLIYAWAKGVFGGFEAELRSGIYGRGRRR